MCCARPLRDFGGAVPIFARWNALWSSDNRRRSRYGAKPDWE
eukprot:gene4316-16024_t